MRKIGVIADTHGFLDPKAVEIFSGCDFILHAGDVGGMDIIRRLEKIAPVVAVSGNHEDDATAKLNWLESFLIDDVKFAVTHRSIPLNMHAMFDIPPDWQKTMGLDNVRVMIFGHSHEPCRIESGGVLYYNPGYAGPDTIEPFRTVGLISINGGGISAETYFLSEPPNTEYYAKAKMFF